MRGEDSRQTSLFIVGNIESMIAQDEPLRRVRELIDEILRRLDGDFAALYPPTGRASIPPEQLMRAQVLMMVESIRSERHLMRHIQYNTLYRWFVGLGATDAVWDVTVFTKNRARFLGNEMSRRMLAEVVMLARDQGLISDEHLTVDGTHIQAWASQKSVVPKSDQDEPPMGGGGRNPAVDFHGDKRSNETHASRTDPDARIVRKSSGDASRLAHAGHALTENRHGLVVDAELTIASGTAERDAAETMLARRKAPNSPCTLGADKGYDVAAFADACRIQRVTPHIAAKKTGSALDERTTRHAGYAISQRRRKLVEEVFGWMKTIAGIRQTKLRGTERVQWQFIFAAACYNLVRIPKLAPQWQPTLAC
jgi:transposase